MKKVYIFGMGEGRKYVERCLLEKVDVCGYIDNYKAEEMGFLNGKPVFKQSELRYRDDYDYIIITLMQYEEVRKSLIEDGVNKEKLIAFFDINNASDEQNWQIFDSYKWRIELMWRHYINIGIPYLDNVGYEMYADSEIMKKHTPQILNAEDTVDILKKDKKCLARFGDNEFELICGRLRTNYQDVDNRLSKRLIEVLNSHEENLLIAIADNYGSLEKYTDDAARDIRMYMTQEVRKNHLSLLDLSRQYYDAYLSRPYIIYRDKENAKKRFDQVREIWNNEDILIIEGEHTRFGVGNDFLKNSKSIERIIAPDKNAFSKYDKIKNAVEKHGKGKLILAILGPTATVLAYDFAKENYWILDIGQIDVEYGWFLLKTDKKCGLKYKNVSEISHSRQLELDVVDEYMEKYSSEIIERIL